MNNAQWTPVIVEGNSGPGYTAHTRISELTVGDLRRFLEDLPATVDDSTLVCNGLGDALLAVDMDSYRDHASHGQNVDFLKLEFDE